MIGAAVLLFIASFLDTFDGSGDNTPNAWDNLGLVMSMYVGGIIGAVLIVIARALPQPPKVVGLDLGQLGVALTIFAAWTSFWSIIDPFGAMEELFGTFGGSEPDSGAGLILGLIAALLLAAAAVATPSSPPSRSLWSAPRVRSPRSRTAPSRPVVTATRVPVRRPPSVRVSRDPASRSRVRGRRSVALRSSRRRPRSRLPVTSRRSGSRCRWPVRCSPRTVRSRRSPNWRRAPGTWRSSSAAPTWWPRPRTAAVASCRTPAASSAADHPPYEAAQSGTKPYRAAQSLTTGPSLFRAGGRCRTVAPAPNS